MEPVYIVNNWCIAAIIDGVAKYKNEIYYFDCIYTEDFYPSNEYNLTLLTKEIYNVFLSNDEYFDEASEHNDIPCLEDYIYDREQSSFEEVFKDYYEREFLYRTEQAYLNNILIENYLKNNRPQIKSKATFYVKNEDYYSYSEREDVLLHFPKGEIKVKWIS